MKTNNANTPWFTKPFQHHRIPTALFSPSFSGMSSESKLTYAVLLSRLCLSHTNGWQTKDGRPYVYCTNQELQLLLNCGHDKATSVLRELESHGLLIRQAKFAGPSRLILLNFAADAENP